MQNNNLRTNADCIHGSGGGGGKSSLRPASRNMVWLARIASGAATVILAALAGYFTLIVASPTEVMVGPMRIEFALKPALQGKSVVNLPPAGFIEADTHSAPATVTYTLEEIAVTQVEELTDPNSAARQALSNWQEPVKNQVNSLLVRLGIISMVAGGAAAALLRRRWKWGLIGAAAGLATVSVVGGLIYKTYDTGAFQEPRYYGNLSRAPEIVAFSQQTLANLDAYEDRVPEIAESLYRTVSELNQLPPALPGGDTIRVLHISDMESSEAAARLTKTVVDLYQVDFIIDTGDSTLLGTPLEARYFSSYLPLPKPYVWVAGNHETPAIVQAMKGTPGMTVLEGNVETVAGVRIMGFPDLSSSSVSPAEAGDQHLAEYAARINATVQSSSPPPFIVAVHAPKLASQLPGKVPVVVNGHTQRESIEVKNGTVFLDAGSTAGGGYRNFEQDRESPSTLHILYIQKNPMKLTAVDTVSIYGFSQEFSVARRVFLPGEGGFKLQEPGGISAMAAPLPH